jgi:hypothetical protein
MNAPGATDTTYQKALSHLRDALCKVSHDSPNELCRIAAEIRDAKDKVREHFVPIFSPENIGKLTADEFKGFLLFKNNHHWDSLHRQGGWMTADMQLLRDALKLLADETLPLCTRLERLRPTNADPMVKGLGRAVITAILQVLYPEKYGVVNNFAEAAMREIGVWPEMPRGTGLADRYKRINDVLVRIAGDLGIDLWTLDMLWWRVSPSRIQRGSQSGEIGAPASVVTTPEFLDGEYGFGLERYLHEFLVDNWSLTVLGSDWDLLEEDGEIVGSHYNTREVGEIDLLAKHKKENRWLVVELKRHQTSDDTVGQLLRYMGWVRRNLVESDASVEGYIVCQEIDKRIQYALDGQPNVKCLTYRVSFALESVPKL